MIVSAVHSYYSYVAAQLVVIGAQVWINGQSVTQQTGGIVDARDWPLTPAVEGTLYLISGRIQPVTGGTPGQTLYLYDLQWTWFFIGTDLAAGQSGNNRGDRHYSNAQVTENLRQANFPGFCQKYDYAVDPVSGLVIPTPASTTVPWSPAETIRWTAPNFAPRFDADSSGIDYGAASVELYAYSDVLPVLVE